jgi:hypothetical protein
MKKYMMLITASLVAGALVIGCGSPAEGNTETATGATANTVTAPTTEAGATAPTADVTAPAPEDKK